MKVSEIQAGRPVSGTFLASQVEKRSARSGKDYLWTVLKDTSGDSIVGLLFDAPPSTFDAVESGTTVEVKGEADEFRGSTNVKIRSIQPASGAMGRDRPLAAIRAVRGRICWHR